MITGTRVSRRLVHSATLGCITAMLVPVRLYVGRCAFASPVELGRGPRECSLPDDGRLPAVTQHGQEQWFDAGFRGAPGELVELRRNRRRPHLGHSVGEFSELGRPLPHDLFTPRA